MSKLIAYNLLLITFILSGCTMRMIPKEVARVDQEIKGNRGFITGRLPYIQEERKDTKTIYDIEIELLSPLDVEKAKKERPSSIKGNRGYIRRKDISEKKDISVKKQEDVIRLKGMESKTPQIIYQVPTGPDRKYQIEKGTGILIEKREEPKIYVVQKGDTLQKISKKMYGTSRRWKKIYKANMDTLESPDMIKPGQKLVIPQK